MGLVMLRMTWTVELMSMKATIASILQRAMVHVVIAACIQKDLVKMPIVQL
jgi:hypothetical protein